MSDPAQITSKPQPIFPDIRQIPEDVGTRPIWCAYDLEWNPTKLKYAKVPCSAITGERKGWTETGVTAAEAISGAKKLEKSGIGIIFNSSDFFGVDSDDCVDADGNIHPAVEVWRQWFPTYQEFSVSRTGVHFICRGTISKALSATPLPEAPGVKFEAYSKGRFFVWTGWRIPGSKDTVQDCSVGIDKLLTHLQIKEPTAPSSAPENARPVSADWVRQLYRDKLAELRNNPVNSGNGNATLRDTALIAARLFASGVFDKREEQFKRELLDIVTKEWAKPHPEDGARQTIVSAWNKGISEGPYKLIEIVKAEELKLPDMPAGVLCGKLGEICRTRLSDFPVAYSWLSVLAAASVLVKPHPMRRCNINVCLVGPVHFGKTQAQERANFLFRLAEQGLVEEVKSGSAEGLLEKIGDRGGSPALWFPDELSHVLEKAQIQNASFPSVLNSLFYKDSNALTVQRRKQVKFNARLSIAGGVVEENFGNSFGAATTAGLYDRFLFGLFPTGSFEYSYRPMQGPPLFDLSQVPRETLFDAQTMSLGPRVESPEIDSSVFDARDAIRKAEKIEPRLLELCIRTALICAAWDGKSELRASDLGPAWELARYQQRVRVVLQPNPGRNFDGIVAHKIMNYLKLHTEGEKWLGWREVYRATKIMDFGSSVAERSMSSLAFAGQIERTTIRPPKGGPEKVLIRLARE
jgi:hypothetical protein